VLLMAGVVKVNPTPIEVVLTGESNHLTREDETAVKVTVPVPQRETSEMAGATETVLMIA
jgi:hypothetical protein